MPVCAINAKASSGDPSKSMYGRPFSSLQNLTSPFTVCTHNNFASCRMWCDTSSPVCFHEEEVCDILRDVPYIHQPIVAPPPWSVSTRASYKGTHTPHEPPDCHFPYSWWILNQCNEESYLWGSLGRYLTIRSLNRQRYDTVCYLKIQGCNMDFLKL